MTIISKIDKYLVGTVTRIRVTTVAGARVEGTLPDISARAVSRTRVLRDASGNQIVSDIIVYLLPDADVFEGDELIVDTLQRPIVGLVEARNKEGVIHHLEAALG